MANAQRPTANDQRPMIASHPVSTVANGIFFEQQG